MALPAKPMLATKVAVAQKIRRFMKSSWIEVVKTCPYGTPSVVKTAGNSRAKTINTGFFGLSGISTMPLFCRCVIF